MFHYFKIVCFLNCFCAPCNVLMPFEAVCPSLIFFTYFGMVHLERFEVRNLSFQQGDSEFQVVLNAALILLLTSNMSVFSVSEHLSVC